MAFCMNNIEISGLIGIFVAIADIIAGSIAYQTGSKLCVFVGGICLLPICLFSYFHDQESYLKNVFLGAGLSVISLCGSIASLVVVLVYVAQPGYFSASLSGCVNSQGEFWNCPFLSDKDAVLNCVSQRSDHNQGCWCVDTDYESLNYDREFCYYLNVGTIGETCLPYFGHLKVVLIASLLFSLFTVYWSIVLAYFSFKMAFFPQLANPETKQPLIVSAR